MNRAPGWEGILERDEQILWQGRPDPGFRLLQGTRLTTMLFGLAFTAFALFWMVGAAEAGGYFWAFGLIHFTVGLGLSFGYQIRDWVTRRNSWYTLSNRRALIATDIPLQGRRLDSYPITADTQMTLTEGKTDSVHFATRSWRNRHGIQSAPVGFEMISEGRKVLALMRKIQKGPQ